MSIGAFSFDLPGLETDNIGHPLTVVGGIAKGQLVRLGPFGVTSRQASALKALVLAERLIGLEKRGHIDVA